MNCIKQARSSLALSLWSSSRASPGPQLCCHHAILAVGRTAVATTGGSFSALGMRQRLSAKPLTTISAYGRPTVAAPGQRLAPSTARSSTALRGARSAGRVTCGTCCRRRRGCGTHGPSPSSTAALDIVPAPLRLLALLHEARLAQQQPPQQRRQQEAAVAGQRVASTRTWR